MKNGFIDLKELAKLEDQYRENPLVLKTVDEFIGMITMIDDIKPNDDTMLDETRCIAINTLEKNKIFKRIGQ